MPIYRRSIAALLLTPHGALLLLSLALWSLSSSAVSLSARARDLSLRYTTRAVVRVVARQGSAWRDRVASERALSLSSCLSLRRHMKMHARESEHGCFITGFEMCMARTQFEVVHHAGAREGSFWQGVAWSALVHAHARRGQTDPLAAARGATVWLRHQRPLVHSQDCDAPWQHPGTRGLQRVSYIHAMVCALL